MFLFSIETEVCVFLRLNLKHFKAFDGIFKRSRC